MIKRFLVGGLAAASFVLVTWQFGDSLDQSHYRVAMSTVDACYLGKGIGPYETGIPPAIVQECTEAYRIYEGGHLRRALISMFVGLMAALVILALYAGVSRLVLPRSPSPRSAS